MALFSAVGAAIFGAGTFLAAGAAFLLKTAVGVGINLLAQAIAGKPKERQEFGVNGTLQVGGDIPRSVILGKTATAGSLVWVNTWGVENGTPNAYLTQVIALSDTPVQSLDEFWVNGQRVTLGGDSHFGQIVNEYIGIDGWPNLTIRFYNGTQTTPDVFLTGTASNFNRTWDATRVGYGVAYAIVTARVTTGMFSGIPSFKFVMTGRRLYDPSRDSTVGGSGGQRWGDPNTWGGDGDHNPAVQIYNLLRGIQHNGQWLYGLQGVGPARLPAADWIAQINKCRAGNIYRAGVEIPVNAPLTSAIETLLTACQGRLSEVGGTYRLFVGEPDAAVASFSDADILSTEGQSFTPFFGLADTINGIAATYPSPADGWAVKSAPPLYRTDLEAMAGNRRLMADVSLSCVPYPEQVQRLMKSALLEGQRARRHTLVLPPQYWPYAVPGATLSWTSERNGYVDKLFRIDGVADRANLDVMVDITEVDPADYDWDSDTDYRVPTDGALGPLRPASQPMVGWQVFPAIVGQAGKELPSIRVAYAGNLEDVRAVRVQVRLTGTDDPFYDGEVPYGDPATNENPSSVVLSGSFGPDTAHEVRGKFVPIGDRPTDWSGWLAVTTPNVWPESIYPIDLDRLADDVRGWQEWAGSGLREVERRLEELDTLIADQDLGNAYDRQQVRQQVTATFESARAEWQWEVNVVAAENYALAQRVEQLDAEVFDEDTGLPAVASAVDALEVEVGNIDGELSAQANAITQLSAAATPGEINEANFRMQVVAGPGGYSRIGFQARQGGSGTWRMAGAFIDVPNNAALPTRFVIVADQAVIMDNAGNVSAMFEAGTTFINNARIRNLNVTNLQVGGVQTQNLAINSVTQPSYIADATAYVLIGQTVVTAQLGVAYSSGVVTGSFQFNFGVSGSNVLLLARVQMWSHATQTWTDIVDGLFDAPAPGISITQSLHYMHLPPHGPGTYLYRVSMQRAGGGSSQVNVNSTQHINLYHQR